MYGYWTTIRGGNSGFVHISIGNQQKGNQTLTTSTAVILDSKVWACQLSHHTYIQGGVRAHGFVHTSPEINTTAHTDALPSLPAR